MTLCLYNILKNTSDQRWHERLQIQKILILRSSWYGRFWWHATMCFYNTKRITLMTLSECRKRNVTWHVGHFFQNSSIIIILQIHGTDTLLISPLYPHLAQGRILWPAEYLANTSVYWSRLSIKSRGQEPVSWNILDFVIRIRINFSLKKELKPKFLLSCFVRLGHLRKNLSLSFCLAT